jgi:NADH-quinone oxidoreductase subunit N
MEFSTLYNNLSLLKPEITVSIVLCLVVLLDIIFHQKKAYLPYFSLAGLAVIAYFVFSQFSYNGFAFSASSSAGPRGYGMITVDPFGAFFKMLVLLASALVIVFSLSSDEVKKSYNRTGEYYTLIFGMVLGMFFMISASDLILMYLSLELVSLSSYVLAGFIREKERSSEAALKYIIYGAISSGIMLFGISILYGMTGSTNLYVINSLLQGPQVNLLAFALAAIFIFVGMGYKISAAPFHFWTPDVYEGAPITITAFLSVASKAAGFALLIRFIRTAFITSSTPAGYWELNQIFNWRELIIIVSILTMTLGNFTALWQDNIKRMLAYSSIAHAGYLLMGLAVLSNQGLTAIMIYFFIYALMNLGAFYIVMLIANKIGSEDIDDYKGLGSKAPFLGVSLGIFLVSLVGLPPTAGFIGKLYLFSALVTSNMIFLAVIALLNTVVSLYYYIRVLRAMFLDKPVKEVEPFKVSILNNVVILALVIPVLLFGIYFTPLVQYAKSSIAILGF